MEEGRLAAGGLIEAAVVVTVLASTFLHGATAYPLARRYGAFATREAAEVEHRETMEMPVRLRHVAPRLRLPPRGPEIPMIAVLSLLFVVAISLTIVRVATVALVLTGMGRDAAAFQARSAFTGVGFTTSEAESVVSHPLRRRIVMWLMFVGNIGIVTAMASLLLSLIDLQPDASAWLVIGALFGGLLVIFLGASSPAVNRRVEPLIGRALRRWTTIDARDYARILHLREDYGISELGVGSADWLCGRTLGAAGLGREGVVVLGVECPGGAFIGAPAAGTEIREGDRLIVYGRMPRIAELDGRAAGADAERTHHDAVAEQNRITGEEHAAAGRPVAPAAATS